MRKIANLGMLALMSVILVAQTSHALTVSVDGTKTWNGYMNVFANNNGAAGGWMFGSGWGLANVKTTVTSSLLTLQPNFNTYADNVNGTLGDKQYWTNYQPAQDVDGDGFFEIAEVPATLGNKWMQGNTFIELGAGTLNNTSLLFQGDVSSYTLSSGYNVYAFIKGLNPNNGYSTDVFQTVALNSSTTSFSVSANTGVGLIIQYGFAVEGLNANPANAGSLGSVQITAVPEPSSAALMGLGVAGLLAFRLRRKV